MDKTLIRINPSEAKDIIRCNRLSQITKEVTQEQLAELSKAAWKARENAVLEGKTAVGAAALSESGKIFPGCNIEGLFRTHTIHAEPCAIGNMVAAGEKKMKAIVIAAKMKLFTPCGSCREKILQFGGPDCVVGFQGAPEAEIQRWPASELFPHYADYRV